MRHKHWRELQSLSVECEEIQWHYWHLVSSCFPPSNTDVFMCWGEIGEIEEMCAPAAGSNSSGLRVGAEEMTVFPHPNACYTFSNYSATSE